MVSFLLVLRVALCVVSGLGAATPSLKEVKKFDGIIKQGSYIVKLKDGVSKNAISSHILDSVTYSYEPSFFNGFAGLFDTDVLNTLRSLEEVDYISEDGILSTVATQNDAPWGLARISTKKKLQNEDPYALSYSYTYNDNPGQGVDIYVVDTGIYIKHPSFGGRASWGATFGGYADADGNGHGTHVAGTAGSNDYGVAKAAKLVAVKVLADNGSGATSDIVAGLNWIYSKVQVTRRPSIATMSLGGGVSIPLDDATSSLSRANIHVTVAAGNDNRDAFFTSPAHVLSAITVGATDITDTRAPYSNYGLVVDVFAPGSYITSTWNDGKTNTISGTSMATPHVAGLVAYFISSTHRNMSPAEMSRFIKSHAVQNQLGDIPLLTPNTLINNAL